MKRLFLFLLVLPCLILHSLGQNAHSSESENLFSKTFSQENYLADFDELAKTLTQTHPTPYKFTSQDAFEAILNKNKRAISDETTYSEFIWRCSEIVASLNCGHTSLGYFNQEEKILPIHLRFPLEARLIEDHLYISDPLINANKVNPEDEIIAINGKNIAQIKKDIYTHISSQGNNESYKRMLFNGYFTAFLPYALGFPDTYSIRLKSKQEVIQLDRLSDYQYKPRVNPQNECQGNLCLSFLPEKKIAVLTIRSFAYYGDKYPLFTDFIDNSFQEIKSKGIKKLILDIRMNGGGPSDAGIYLLRHLAKEPFAYFSSSAFDEKKERIKPLESRFQGDLYMLIDGEGGSTTGHFTSLVKQLNLGTLIGEELGSNQYCTGGQKKFQLSHTNINYQVGRYTYVSAATSFPADRGILPDHFIIQPIQDFIKNRDTVMEYTLGLIEGKE